MQSPDRLRISTEIRVMYFDTDASGVVHNIAYLRFIETARTLLALRMGMSFEEIAQTKYSPDRRAHRNRLQEARLPR